MVVLFCFNYEIEWEYEHKCVSRRSNLALHTHLKPIVHAGYIICRHGWRWVEYYPVWGSVSVRESFVIGTGPRDTSNDNGQRNVPQRRVSIGPHALYSFEDVGFVAYLKEIVFLP